MDASRILILGAAGRDFHVFNVRLCSTTFAAGSMGPKVESAIAFASVTGHPSWIGRLGELRATLRGETGTRLDAGDQRGA